MTTIGEPIGRGLAHPFLQTDWQNLVANSDHFAPELKSLKEHVADSPFCIPEFNSIANAIETRFSI
jgi:hypothetical protein